MACYYGQVKLFLSSIRLPTKNEQAQLFGDKSPVVVTVVPNAWDVYPEEQQKTELENTLAQFKNLNYHASIMDLVTSSSEQIKNKLTSSDFVWVMGGNSFYLNHLVRKSSFDSILRKALDEGLVYGGTSAGAVIAGHTLHGAENADDPNKAPEIIWEGMGLVDFGIVPHWGMEKYADALEKMRTDMQPYTSHVITLTNDQAIIVRDNKIQSP